MVVINWFGLSAPASTPAAVQEKIAAALMETVTQGGLKSRFEEIGFEAAAMPSSEFATFVRDQLSLWTDIVRRSGVSVN